jgi:hypothetical protein
VKPFFDALREPEYVHVLLNPLPVYGLAAGALALVVALWLRSRSAAIAALAVVLVCAASAWPVYEYGQRGYDRVFAMADSDGQAWLDAHLHRAEQLIWGFYALAALAAAAIAVPVKWPRAGLPLAGATLLAALAILGAGGWIAYAGGKVRHREFRHEPPPPKSAGP